MRILLIGDIIGKPGRYALQKLLPGVRREYRVDLVVANGENAAAGFGLTEDTAREILDSEVDVITSGAHIWDKKEVIPHLDGPLPILRPLNYPPGVPGRGYIKSGNAMVVNAQGRVFFKEIDCPFRAMDSLLNESEDPPPVIVVDFHAEATSEKIAMGWYLDSKVTAVVGTHTHVQTADARLLPGGTACITDVGMTGPHNSVIGVEKSIVISRFINGLPNRFETASGDPRLHAVVVTADSTTGRAINITRLSLNLQDVESLTAQPVA